jgi:hypothetical protein
VNRAKTVQVIRHEVMAQCGSYEVRFPDRRTSRFFFWYDTPSQRMRPDLFTRERALEAARKLALTEQDKL